MSDCRSYELGDGRARLERRVREEGEVYVQDIDLFSESAQPEAVWLRMKCKEMFR